MSQFFRSPYRQRKQYHTTTTWELIIAITFNSLTGKTIFMRQRLILHSTIVKWKIIEKKDLTLEFWIIFKPHFCRRPLAPFFEIVEARLKIQYFFPYFLYSFNYGIFSWKYFSLTSFSIEKVCQNRLVESCRLSLEKKALVNWAQRNQYCPFFSKSEKNARGNLGTHNDSANITPNF